MALKRDAVLASAEKLIARGRYDGALKEYLRLLQENPSDILVLNKVGDLYVQLNRVPDAVNSFSRIAEHYARDGFFLKAIAIYKKINKLDPSRLDVYESLAELHLKQGMITDARMHYQILADHYSKQNQMDRAIEVYRKLAAADPNDIRTPVRLADLLTSTGRKDEALMQYGVVGSMLAQRGATDEAVAVFQKALKIRPGDPKTLQSLVRSLLESRSAETAVALLKAEPRNATTMTLLAEALYAAERFDEAANAAEGALAFDQGRDEARQILAAIQIRRGDGRRAFATLAPLVDHAVRAGEVKRAIAMLEPLARDDRVGDVVLEKLFSLYQLAGDRERSAATLAELARRARGQGDEARAAELYRQLLELDPENAEARLHARGATGTPVPTAPQPIPVAPAPTPPPAPAPAPPPARESSEEHVVDLDEAALRETGPVPIAGAPGTATTASGAEEKQWQDGVTEAEVFAKYGLLEKAAEKFRSLVRQRPDALAVRQRYVAVLGELGSPAIGAETAALAEALRQAGRSAEAESLEGPPPAGRAPAPAPPPEETGLPASPRPAAFTLDFDDLSELSIPAPPAAPPAHELTHPDLEIAPAPEVGKVLEEQMRRPGRGPEAEPAPPAVDEAALFSDEQRFFDLASELEKELTQDEAPSEAAGAEAGDEISLEEIFREFKRGVEQKVNPEDYETHFNLGIAYKEMGLLDEAIGEFQFAARDPGRAVECCSMLGLCFREKGLPQLAAEWFARGLQSPGITREESLGLRYELAGVREQMGDVDGAYQAYLEIYGENAGYRDVSERMRAISQARQR